MGWHQYEIHPDRENHDIQATHLQSEGVTKEGRGRDWAWSQQVSGELHLAVMP